MHKILRNRIIVPRFADGRSAEVTAGAKFCQPIPSESRRVGRAAAHWQPGRGAGAQRPGARPGAGKQFVLQVSGKLASFFRVKFRPGRPLRPAAAAATQPGSEPSATVTGQRAATRARPGTVTARSRVTGTPSLGSSPGRDGALTRSHCTHRDRLQPRLLH